MTEGVVVGGWGYVWAAYAITAIAFVVYGVILVTRLREERSRAESLGATE
jgi:heme exporter protein D